MELVASPVSPERFAEVKLHPDCVTYCENYPTAGLKQPYWISVYGIYTAEEIFVQVTSCNATRVRSFISRHKGCPPALRRKELPLVDVADAFSLARTMIRSWGHRSSRAPFP